MNIYQTNAYRNDIGWLHFNDEQAISVGLRSIYSCLLFIQLVQVAAKSNSPDITAIFHARLYNRYIEISKDERNFTEQIKAPIFLQAVLTIHKSHNTRDPTQFRKERQFQHLKR